MDTSEAHARQLDADDPLAAERENFEFPVGPDGRPVVYLTGNSLGLMPKRARELVNEELEDWSRFGVHGHDEAKRPWYRYHEQVREPLARLVGALPHETVAMNTLTVNCHLLMVSFYRPTPQRHKILVEGSLFPSDAYAVASQAAFHGYEPRDAVLKLEPRDTERTLRDDDILRTIDEHGDSIALVWMGGVNYATGQLFDMEQITRRAHERGCMVGFDLAHAAGNVPMHLHDWNVDCAAWCSYKYLNSGPGAIASAFVHERHVSSDLPRFCGWWGNDPTDRFEMRPGFEPVASADAWQLSNPPILSMTPMIASLDIFDRVGMEALRAKSVKLTGYMESLLHELCADRVEVITPVHPNARGAQLSLRVPGQGRGLRNRLADSGIVVDYREPDIFRAAPVPMYVRYTDVHRFVTTLADLL